MQGGRSVSGLSGGLGVEDGNDPRVMDHLNHDGEGIFCLNYLIVGDIYIIQHAWSARPSRGDEATVPGLQDVRPGGSVYGARIGGGLHYEASSGVRQGQLPVGWIDDPGGVIFTLHLPQRSTRIEPIGVIAARIARRGRAALGV